MKQSPSGDWACGACQATCAACPPTQRWLAAEVQPCRGCQIVICPRHGQACAIGGERLCAGCQGVSPVAAGVFCHEHLAICPKCLIATPRREGQCEVCASPELAVKAEFEGWWTERGAAEVPFRRLKWRAYGPLYWARWEAADQSSLRRLLAKVQIAASHGSGSLFFAKDGRSLKLWKLRASASPTDSCGHCSSAIPNEPLKIDLSDRCAEHGERLCGLHRFACEHCRRPVCKKHTPLRFDQAGRPLLWPLRRILRRLSQRRPGARPPRAGLRPLPKAALRQAPRPLRHRWPATLPVLRGS